MSSTPHFLLTYANIPFVADKAFVVRKKDRAAEQEVSPPVENSPLRKQQPLVDLIDEIDRLMPWKYLNDMDMPGDFPGYFTSQLARKEKLDVPDRMVGLGDWYYPTGAGRWGIFRYLATGSMAAQMLAATSNGVAAAPFIMQQVPLVPNPKAANDYLVQTNMSMLPPRVIGEYGGGYDGLYLITLVDERYYFQGTPATLRVTGTSTWDGLISQLAGILGISVSYSPISSTYNGPEPDSQFWTNAEDAAALLDAVCHNIGRTCVRNLNGTYFLLTPWESRAVVLTNRPDNSSPSRIAGSEIFQSGMTAPAKNLTGARNTVVPQQIIVSFPKYILGTDPVVDPVPHFYNPRYNASGMRPSAWFEEPFGDTYQISTPIAQGAPPTSGFGNLTGVSEFYIHDTAKAVYNLESQAGGDPINVGALQSLALQISQDAYANLVLTPALDETYPGTFAWQPDGLHDIIWTWSEKRRLACTRVVHSSWNNNIKEMQHGLPGSQAVQPGVGGRSVAQTWRGSGNTQVYGANLVTALSGISVSAGLFKQGIQEVIIGLDPITSGPSNNLSFIQGPGGTPIWSGVNEVTAQSGLVINSGTAGGKIKIGLDFSGITINRFVYNYSGIYNTYVSGSTTVVADGFSKFAYTTPVSTIANITGGVAGQVIVIANLSTTPTIIVNNNAGAGSIITPLFSNYTLQPSREIQLQFSGIVWNFMHPTLGVGTESSILTYGADRLKIGSGLNTIDSGDGSNVIWAPPYQSWMCSGVKYSGVWQVSAVSGALVTSGLSGNGSVLLGVQATGSSPTGTHGSASTNTTATLATSYSGVGISVNLPSAGDYQVLAEIVATLGVGTGGGLLATSNFYKLRAVSGAGDFGLPSQNSNISANSNITTITLIGIVSATGPDVVEVQGQTDNALGGGSMGTCYLEYFKLN